MDFVQTILDKQNKKLLEIIANEKFNDEESKQEFVNKYDKKNYKKFIEVKECNIDFYKKIIDAFDK